MNLNYLCISQYVGFGGITVERGCSVVSINVGNFSQNALPPSDAIILFNGNGLDEWKSTKGKKVKWKSTPDYFEAKKGTGSIITKKSFGDVQLHIEWSTPTKIEGESQGRGRDR